MMRDRSNVSQNDVKWVLSIKIVNVLLSTKKARPNIESTITTIQVHASINTLSDQTVFPAVDNLATSDTVE